MISVTQEGRAMVNRIPVFLLIVFAAVLMVLFPGCGKKGPPFLPQHKLNSKVDRLSGKWKDGHVVLDGYVPGEDKKRSDVTGCRIYHAWYSAENLPCEGCPIEMSGFKEINNKIISGDRFNCDIPGIEKRGIWFFEVRLVGKGGALGPPSERVKVTIDAPVK